MKDLAAMGPTRSDSDNESAYFLAESSLVLDYAMGQEARDYVSSFFWDNAEADAVAAVVLAMEDIWEKHPRDARNRAYWTDPDWPKVIELAGKAHALMVENDRKHGVGETEVAGQDGDDKDSARE